MMKRFFCFFVLFFAVAALGSNDQFDFTGKPGAVIRAQVTPLAEFAPPFRHQILTRGADSSESGWQLAYVQWSDLHKPQLMLICNNGRKQHFRLNSTAYLLPFQKNDVAAVFDGKEVQLFHNGILLGKQPFAKLPPGSSSPLKIGEYAFDGKFPFPGRIEQISGVARAEVPPRTTPVNTPKKLLAEDWTTGKNGAFTPTAGKWKNGPAGFGEQSDHADVRARIEAKTNPPSSFVMTFPVVTYDSLGTIFAEFCAKDADNGYLLEHRVGNSGLTSLMLFRNVGGKKAVLGEVSTLRTPIPTAGTAAAPLFFSIARHGDMIHVRVNGRELLALRDDTFHGGNVALGAHERKVDFKRFSLTSYPGYQVTHVPKKVPEVELTFSHPALRSAFYRDETPVFTVERINRSNKTLAEEVAVVMIGNERRSVRLPAIAPGKRAAGTIAVPGLPRRDGAYQVTVSCGKESVRSELYFATRPELDRHAFYSWTGGIKPDYLKQLLDHGFNGSAVTITPNDDPRELRPLLAAGSDFAVRNGMSLGAHMALLGIIPPGGNAMRTTQSDGKQGKLLNPRRDDTRAYARKTTEAFMALLRDYPVFGRVLIDSEIENHMEQSFAKEDIERAERELGFAPPSSENSDMVIDNMPGRVMRVPESVKKSIPAVFPADNRYYRFMTYFWQRGFGDNLLRAELAPLIRKAMPGIRLYHDPFRDVPLAMRNLGMDWYGTWYYCHPDAGETFMAAESMMAAARASRENQGFQIGPSLWLYQSEIGPARTRWAGVQPTNIYLEALHLAFAAKPSVLEFYDVTFLMPQSNPEFREATLLPGMHDFVERFVAPLWSATRRLDREQPKSALLLSMASQIFDRQNWGGYGRASANAVLNLLWKAQIPTSILFEESIRNGELNSYDQLFLHGVMHLPQDVFDAVRAFAERGGRVIADANSPWIKLLPGAVGCSLDTSKITRSGYYLMQKHGGSPADAVYDEQQKIAARLRKNFGDRAGAFATSPSNELYLRTLSQNGSHYVFALNDKRTFGDYFGKRYRAVYDAGLPLRTEVSLAKSTAVYEYPAQKLLAAPNGRVTLDFAPTEGKVFIVYPQAVGSVIIHTPPPFKPGKEALFKVEVRSKNGKLLEGVQPIRMRLTAPDGRVTERFGSTADGRGSFSYLPGANEPPGMWQFEAEELASGTKTKHSWKDVSGLRK